MCHCICAQLHEQLELLCEASRTAFALRQRWWLPWLPCSWTCTQSKLDEKGQAKRRQVPPAEGPVDRAVGFSKRHCRKMTGLDYLRALSRAAESHLVEVCTTSAQRGLIVWQIVQQPNLAPLPSWRGRLKLPTQGHAVAFVLIVRMAELTFLGPTKPNKVLQW